MKTLRVVLNGEDCNRLSHKNVLNIMGHSYAQGKIVSAKSQDTNDFLSGAGKPGVVFSNMKKMYIS